MVADDVKSKPSCWGTGDLAYANFCCDGRQWCPIVSGANSVEMSYCAESDDYEMSHCVRSQRLSCYTGSQWHSRSILTC